MNLGSILASWVVYGPGGLKSPSWLLQDCLLEPIWTQHGPKLAPTCFKLGPCWLQVGSNLPQVGAMLGPDLGFQPPLSQPKPFQILSQALPDPIQEATSHPPGLGSWIGSLGRCILHLPNHQLGPRNTSTWNYAFAGVRVHIRIYIYIYIYTYIHTYIGMMYNTYDIIYI